MLSLKLAFSHSSMSSLCLDELSCLPTKVFFSWNDLGTEATYLKTGGRQPMAGRSSPLVWHILVRSGAPVKIWHMPVTAFLGEAVRWARSSRVCNKPALFWHFGGALGETHTQNIPGNRPSIFSTWKRNTPRNGPPKHTIYIYIYINLTRDHDVSALVWKDQGEDGDHSQQRQTMPKNTDPGRHLATMPWISLLHSFGGGTPGPERGRENNLDMCFRKAKTHQALAFANSWLLQPEKREKTWGQMRK